MAEGKLTKIAAALGAAVLLGLLGGCTFDYLNHLDRVTLAGGDAVRANLERETANPTKPSAYETGGLGKDGDQIPDEEADTGTAPPP